MAARSSEVQSISPKTIRITYDNLVKLADDLDKDKKKKHSKVRSKEKSKEGGETEGKTGKESEASGDKVKGRSSIKDKVKNRKERRKSEKNAEDGVNRVRTKEDEKRTRRSRSIDGGKTVCSSDDESKVLNKSETSTAENYATKHLLEPKFEKDSTDSKDGKIKHHKHSSKSKGKLEEKTADTGTITGVLADTSNYNDFLDKDEAVYGGGKTRRPEKEERRNLDNKKNTKGRVREQDRPTKERNKSSKSQRKLKQSSLEDEGAELGRMDTYVEEKKDGGDEDELAQYEQDQTLTSRSGGILRVNSLKSKHAHVRFNDKTMSRNLSEEEMGDSNSGCEIRGIIRLPDGLDIGQEGYNFDTEAHAAEINEQDVEKYGEESQSLRSGARSNQRLFDPNNPEQNKYIIKLEAAVDISKEKKEKKMSGSQIQDQYCKDALNLNLPCGEDIEEKSDADNGENVKQSKAEKRHKALNRQRAQQLLKCASQAEVSLSNLLSKDITSREGFSKARSLSREIQEFYKGAIMLDLSYASQHEVDQSLWRNAFYHVIETLRKFGKLFLGYSNQKDIMTPEEINSELWNFLEESSLFYSNLVEALQSTYNFDVHKIVNQQRRADFMDRNARLALLSCHHILIFLGDIERYKEQMQPLKTVNWGSVRSWYLKACKLAPKNGKPYNQLAVIAVYANRKLDAVYYYIRSLAVNSPILTARETLTTIFYEIQRKAEKVEEDERREMQRRQKENQHRGGRGRGRGRSQGREVGKGVGLMAREERTNARHEVWVFMGQGIRRFVITDDGQVLQVSSTGKPLNQEKDDADDSHSEPKPESPKISLQEVNKKFVLHFLCAHGLLYSRTGMERLPALHCQLMGEFHTLLGYSQCSSVSCTTLLQMAAINMFAVDYTAPQENPEACVRVGTPQDQALNLVVDMLILLLNACVTLLNTSNGNADDVDASFHGDDSGYHDNVGISATLRQYLPAIKVWSDWMTCHPELWQASSISTHRRLWETVSQFTNALIQLELPNCQEDKSGEELVVLMEDEFLAGFKPLTNAKRFSMKIISLEQKELAEAHLRILAIKEFACFLTSLDNPPLKYSDETGLYSAIIASLPNSPDVKSPSVVVHMDIDHTAQEESDNDDVIIESVKEELDSGGEGEKGFRELKARKDALAKEVEVHRERHDRATALLNENISRPHLMLENYPTYLVPDTNCFVDHLDGLQATVQRGDFTLVVPLVVINELDGLKKDLMVDKYRDRRHAQLVQDNARSAVDFLEDQFSLRNPQVQALTSRGSVMDTIAFRSEDPSARKGNNDDVILSCCLHYCEENFVNRLATADQPITIRRKVVLLTDDRNLRLKAYTRNVPVLTVPLFRKMARL